jgi:glucose/mannose-6-phosphate isomerase
VALLVLLHQAKFITTDPVPELEAASHDLSALAARCAPEVPETENPAKRLARSWYGCFPFFYSGPGLTRPVGVRWKGQVHENAKALAATSTFPELDHNEIMAWGALPEVRRLCRLVFLRDRDDPPRLQRGMLETAAIVGPHVAAIDWVETEGTTALERMLGAALLGDFASVYLAFLNGADPSPMPEIDLLKQRLAARP